MREGNAIPCIKHEAIRNCEWYGPPLLPGVYNLADAEWEYMFRDDGVVYYAPHESVWISFVEYVTITNHEYVHEEGLRGVLVSIILSHDPYDLWAME